MGDNSLRMDILIDVEVDVKVYDFGSRVVR